MPMLPIKIYDTDKIAIVAPHPDDESIGAGGLLSLFSHQCTVILMTDGRHGDSKVNPEVLKQIRYDEFQSVITKVNCRSINMEFEDGTLMGIQSCFDRVDFAEYTKVFLPAADDNHPDHMAACLYALDRIRQQGLTDIEVYQYEVHLPLHQATHYLDISESIDVKVDLIDTYQSQMKIHDYPSQVRALANYRACQNNFSGKYHEVYLKTTLELNLAEDLYVEQEKRIEKLSQSNRIYSKWIDIQIKNKKFCEYLKQIETRNIAIYGWGDIGRKLYWSLQSTDINVRYIIDKNITDTGVESLEVRFPKANDMPVDMVIITVIGSCDAIQNELLSLNYQHVVSLNSILEEMLL